MQNSEEIKTIIKQIYSLLHQLETLVQEGAPSSVQLLFPLGPGERENLLKKNIDDFFIYPPEEDSSTKNLRTRVLSTCEKIFKNKQVVTVNDLVSLPRSEFSRHGEKTAKFAEEQLAAYGLSFQVG